MACEVRARMGGPCLQQMEQESVHVFIGPNICFFFSLFKPQMLSQDMFYSGGEGERPRPAITDKTWVRSATFPSGLASRAGSRLPSSSLTQAMGCSPLPLGIWPRTLPAPHSNVFPVTGPQAPFLGALQLSSAGHKF